MLWCMVLYCTLLPRQSFGCSLPDPWKVLSEQSVITRPIFIVVFSIDPGGSVFDCAVGVSIMFDVGCGYDDDEYSLQCNIIMVTVVMMVSC